MVEITIEVCVQVCRLISMVFALRICWVQQVWAQETTLSSEVRDASYQIGSGDTIELIVWAGQKKETTLSGEYFVFNNGCIEFPLLDSVSLAGKTMEEASKDIQNALKIEYIRDPHVSIKMKEYGSQTVHVLGAVEKPGSFTMQKSMGLAEVLAKAGGTDSTIKGAKQVKISRNNSENIVVDLEKMLLDGTGNVPLMPDDVIYVTEGQFIVVNGKVKAPGNVPWREGMTVTEAISAAGGATDNANLREVFLVRGVDRIPINVKKIAQGRESDMPILQGDKLFVEESLY